MTKSATLALVATLALAACGGGGGSGSSVPFTQSGSTTPQSDAGLPITAATVATANSMGSALQSFATFESSELGSQAVGTLAVRRDTKNGSCVAIGGTNSMEFNSPDLSGDTNSTEVQYFYDNACVQIARDTVRQWIPISATEEDVTTTQKQYAQGLSTAPTAVRSDTVIVSGTLGQYGYPVVSSAYNRQSTGALFLGTQKVLLSDFDLVMGAQEKGTSQFCSDDAGFSIAAVDEADGLNYNSYGWSAQVTSGTRTVNSDGTVTWSSNHKGYSYFGPAGSISLASTVPGTTCPIAPYTIAAGTGAAQAGFRSMTVTATYTDGLLTNMVISNASLDSALLGTNSLVQLTMNVTTQTGTGANPSSSDFIMGTIYAGKTELANFNVNAFGDGTLNVVSGGSANSFNISDWHVMHNPNVNV